MTQPAPGKRQWLPVGVRSGPADKAAFDAKAARKALEGLSTSWHLHEAVVMDRTRRVSQALQDPKTSTSQLNALAREVHLALGGK